MNAVKLQPRLVPQSECERLRAMLDNYLSDLSAFGHVDASYPYFNRYWKEPEQRWPYFLECEVGCAGFAMVRLPEPHAAFEMAEFCIVPKMRRVGLGLIGAKAILALHPGQWKIDFMRSNAGAKFFWRKVLDSISTGPVRLTETEKRFAYGFKIIGVK